MTSVFDATLQGMKETREQIRAFRKAAEARMFGDLDYHREVVRMERMDREARDEPPPVDPPTIPGWRRHNFAMRRRTR